MVNLGSEKCIRCLNCWKLYPNSKSILDHWNNGKCLHYCSICGKSFHHNIKSIRDHFPEEHGIKYRIPERPAKFSAKELLQKRADHKASTCNLCNITFANRYAKNSHMRLHKRESANLEQSNRVSSPATSASSAGSGDNKKRNLSALQTNCKSSVLSKGKQFQRLQPGPKLGRRIVPKSTPLLVKRKSVDVRDLIKHEFVDMDNSAAHSANYINVNPTEQLVTDEGGPRLQVKKLVDLQEPFAPNNMDAHIQVGNSTSFYENTCPQLNMQSAPGYITYIGQSNVATQPIAQSHAIPALDIPQQNPFQISAVQQVPSSQFYDYNPMFNVQPATGFLNVPSDPNGYHQSYVESNEYQQFT